MLTRIVRMEFTPEGVQAFLEIFQASRERIRAFEGCLHLELQRDASDPCVFYTFSQWCSEEDLNRYRQSELFQSVWPRTKALFAARPQAFSMKEFGV